MGGQIQIIQEDKGDLVNIEIKDSGMGIPMDIQQHLFERFAHSTDSGLQAGSGIGLALTKELIELHGGHISVKSVEGAGSIFQFSININRGFFNPSDIVESKELESQQLDHLLLIPTNEYDQILKPKHSTGELLINNKPSVLVVEDNAEVRNYVVEQLQHDYKIIESINGKEGFEKANEVIPDLIITDIMMPEMNGMELCQLLKSSEKTNHIPVIMLTARVEQPERLAALKIGADDYLVKPFVSEELLTRIFNLIEQRKRLQEHYQKSFHLLSAGPISDESADQHFLRKIHQIIENYMEQDGFSVSLLSKEIGMSRSQLHRKLTALTGFSPNQIIRNMRLELAQVLLKKKVGNASEIAYRTGFSSPSYFAKCFKEYFGISPSDI